MYYKGDSNWKSTNKRQRRRNENCIVMFVEATHQQYMPIEHDPHQISNDRRRTRHQRNNYQHNRNASKLVSELYVPNRD